MSSPSFEEKRLMSTIWFTLVETRLHGWTGELSTEKYVRYLLSNEDNNTCDIIPCKSINKIRIPIKIKLYISFDPYCKLSRDELNLFEVFTNEVEFRRTKPSSKKAASELDDLSEVVEIRAVIPPSSCSK